MQSVNVQRLKRAERLTFMTNVRRVGDETAIRIESPPAHNESAHTSKQQVNAMNDIENRKRNQAHHAQVNEASNLHDFVIVEVAHTEHSAIKRCAI